MLHLIALAKSNDQDIAYHYATTDPKQFATQKAKLGDINDQPVSIHVLKTDSIKTSPVSKKWTHILPQSKKSPHYQNFPSSYLKEVVTK